MRKSTIIGLVLTILGVILTAVALGHTGFKTIVWDNGLKVADEQTQGLKPITKQLKSFDQLNFQTESGVVIKTGNVDRPTVSYPKFNHVTQSGNTLTIDGAQRHRTRIIGFSINSYNDDGGKVTITVPKKMTLKGVDGHTYNEVTMTDLSLDQLKLSGDADVEMTNVKVHSALNLTNTDDTTLKNVSAPGITQSSDGGDLTYQNADFSKGASQISTDGGDVSVTETKLKDATINSDGGDVKLINNHVTSSVTVNTDGSDIEAVIPDRKHVQISTKADGGGVSLFGKSGSDSWQMGKTNAALYRLSTDGGDVTVR